MKFTLCLWAILSVLSMFTAYDYSHAGHQKRKAQGTLEEERASKRHHTISNQDWADVPEAQYNDRLGPPDESLDSAPEVGAEGAFGFELPNAQSDLLDDSLDLRLEQQTVDHGSALSVQNDSIEFISYCRLCQEGFASPKELAYHIRSIHPKVPAYPCQGCPWEGESENALEIHIQTEHMGWEPYLCHFCPKSFATHSNLLNHEKRTHTPGFYCSICWKRLASQKSLMAHLNTHFRNQYTLLDLVPFKCTECDIREGTAATLADHIRRSHPAVDLYPCQLCPWKGGSQDDFDEHTRTKHPYWKPYVCVACGHRNRTDKSLGMHWSKKHRAGGENWITPSEMGWGLDLGWASSGVTSELEIPQGWGDSSVPVDEVNFLNLLPPASEYLTDGMPCSSAENPEAGIQAATELEGTTMGTELPILVEPFRCKECPAAFDEDPLLAKHIRDHHEGYQPYPCQLCPWQGDTQREWSLHIKAEHPNWLPYSCKLCQRKFRTKAYLTFHNSKIHTLEITPVPKMICEYCNRAFASKSHYNKHLISHLNGKWFYCNYSGCKKRFKNSDKLDSHRRTNHPGVEASEEREAENLLVADIRLEVQAPPLSELMSLLDGAVQDLTQPDCVSAAIEKAQRFQEELDKLLQGPVYFFGLSLADRKNLLDGVLDAAREFKTASLSSELALSQDLRSVAVALFQTYLSLDSRYFDSEDTDVRDQIRETVRLDLENIMNPNENQLSENKATEGIQSADFKSACRLCSKSFPGPKKLSLHIRRAHIGEKEFPCQFPECEVSEETEEQLDKHVAHAHPDWYPYSCLDCSRRFQHFCKRSKHKRVCHPKRLIQCSLCSKKTKSKRNWREHLKAVHHLSPNQFGEPRYIDSIPSSEKVPTASDSELTSFRSACRHCTESFSTPGSLAKHIRLRHPGEPLFPCQNPGCDVGVENTQALDAHVHSQHPGWRPYDCKLCDDLHTFPNYSEILIHKSQVHPSELYICPRCSKKCKRKDHLKKHLKSHLCEPQRKGDSGGPNGSHEER